MSAPRTHEQRLLARAGALLTRAVRDSGVDASAGIEVLEAAVCSHNGWSLEDYRTGFTAPRVLANDVATVWADKLLDQLAEIPIPLPLALAGLAQPGLDRAERRRAGAYYTDFRLARYLASQFAGSLEPGRVIDLASGSGMLLAALTLEVSGGDASAAAAFVAERVCAADLHPAALIATRVALAGTVADMSTLRALEPRLLVGDSLLRSAEEWEGVAPGGFAAVIGNPPWEKLKVTRHEVLTAAGFDRHYGADYAADSSAHLALGYDEARSEMLRYIDALRGSRQLQGSGEADLYKLFLELGLRVLRPRGQLGLLVPAGLIRSQGTQALREHLVDHCPEVSLTVFENRAAFFVIDTRFKFLSLHLRVGTGRRAPLRLRHGAGTAEGVLTGPDVRVSRPGLRRVRENLTVPEVRTEQEWLLFERLVKRGTTLADWQWQHSYMRELDMTNDRGLFRSGRTRECVPLLEGRMVHQHRVMAKAHVSGTGRAAVWQPLSYARARLAPQFWVWRSDVPRALAERVDTVRAGFCDVTGQTNERTVLAAVVPAGVVCGNKVPTLTFHVPELDSATAALAWVAIVNSIPVDWAARRVVTTSLNYFLLRTLPLPRLSTAELADLAAAAQPLRDAEGTGRPPSELADVRAEVDAMVAHAFGLSVQDVALMFGDFRLLDRGQPALPGEQRSTVTRDLVLTALERRIGHAAGGSFGRLHCARQVGAVAFVPADYAGIVRR